MASGTSLIAGDRRGVEQHVMQVDAVDDDVGVLKRARNDGPVGIRVAGQRIVHSTAGGESAFSQAPRGLADAVEHMKDVRAELDAAADGAERGRAFEHADRDAVARERKRGGEPAEPAADDQDGIAQGHDDNGGFTAVGIVSSLARRRLRQGNRDEQSQRCIGEALPPLNHSHIWDGSPGSNSERCMSDTGNTLTAYDSGVDHAAPHFAQARWRAA